MEARARAAGVPVVDFDPECDPAFKADPFGSSLAARRIAPIVYSRAANGFWVVSTYELLREICQQPQLFSSCETFTFYRNPPQVRTLPANLDPPEHTKIRQLLNPLLSPQAVQRLEPAARASVGAIIDGIAERGQCDFMEEVALRIPAEVFLEHMGLPLSNAPDIVATRLLPGALNESNDPGGVRLKAAVEKINGMFADAIRERRAAPRDDIPSYLLQQQVDGRPLTDEELLQLCYTLLGTSLGTTASTMAFLFDLLARKPELQDQLRNDPGMVSGMVEEALRYFPAIFFLGRTVTEDTEFHGLRWRRGDRILLVVPSANRDADVFADPEQFDVDRAPNRHVGFGLGPHRCAGAHLARMELRVLLEEWHHRIARYWPADAEPVTHEVSVTVRMTTLPLHVEAAGGRTGLHEAIR